MNSKKSIALVLGLSLLLTPSLAPAHGLYWEAGDDGATLMVGHHGSSAHGGADNHPCPVHLVEAVRVFEDGWRDLDPTGPTSVTIPAGVRTTLVAVDWGWWVKTRDGSRACHPDSATGVLQAWRTRETLVLLGDAGAPLPEPPQGGLIVLPAGDLDGLRPGDKAAFQVLFQGQPAADVTVAHQGEVRGSTDSKGMIRLKLREAGPQTIRAGLRRDAPGGHRRRLNHNAQLDFTLEEKK